MFGESHRFDILGSMFDLKQKSMQIGIAETINGIRLGYIIDRSRKTDQLNGLEDWETRPRLNSSFKTGRVAVSAFGGFSQFGRNNGHSADDFTDIGLSLAWDIIKNLSFKLNYRETLYETRGSRSSGDISLTWKMLNLNTLTLTIRNQQNWLAEEGPTYFELAYSQYLGVPVGYDDSLGALCGVVYDSQASGTFPVANVTLLMNRMAAVTDAKGRFVFAR